MSRSRATVSAKLREALVDDRRTIRALRYNLRDALALAAVWENNYNVECRARDAERNGAREFAAGQGESLRRLNIEIRHKNDLIDRLTRANAELHKAVEVEKGFAGKLADAVHALLSAQYREGQIKRWSAADFARAEFREVDGAAIGTANKT